MWTRGWGWVLPALIMLVGAWGCAGDDSSANYGVDGGYWGGQTGSLRPCSTPAFAPTTPSVPTGDAAVVFHTGCPMDTQFKITDANGEPVPFELEMLDDGVVLVKTDDTLSPGNYRVETPDGAEKTITVTEAVPVPSQMGTLRRDGDCDARFVLKFDETVVPYLPLMRLEYSLDGGPRGVWFEYGTIPTADSARLEVSGVQRGSHRIEVFGVIAGEDMGPDPAAMNFSIGSCVVDTGNEDRTFCSLSTGGAGAERSAGGAALALLGFAFAFGRRRRESLTRRGRRSRPVLR